MSMSVDELAPPSGEAAKFDTIGDTLKGVVSYVGKWVERTNKFTNKQEEVLKIIVETDDGPRAIYPVKGKQMPRAIGDALRASGAAALEVGGRLAVRYSGNEDTGKGNPMKVFVAQYEPPKATAAVKADDLF